MKTSLTSLLDLADESQLGEYVETIDPDRVAGRTVRRITERVLGPGQYKSSRPALNRWIPAASAAVCAIVLIAVAVNTLHSDPDPVLSGVPSVPRDSAQIFYHDNVTGSDPGYVPAYSSPSLEEIYGDPLFGYLLPRKLLSGCRSYKSYLTEEDPVVHSRARAYLSVSFKTGSEPWDSLEIKVSEHDGAFSLLDPNDPGTYRLSLYYGPEASGRVGADRPAVFGCFYPDDITREIIAERIYVFSDGLCKAAVALVYGDRILSYGYTGDPAWS